MSGSKAEPKRDGATVAAFEIDIVSSMNLAVGNTLSFYSRAFSTKELVFLKFYRLLLSFNTVHHTAKVGFFALIASEVGHFK